MYELHSASFSSKYMQRQFSHTRFIFLLIIVLNTLDTKDHTDTHLVVHKIHFERDLRYCHKCFAAQIQYCLSFFKQIQTDKEFSIRQLLALLPKISLKRNNHLLKLTSSNEKLITKYLFKRNKGLSKISSNVTQLRSEFLHEQENLQGIQYAPLKTINNFVKDLQKLHKNFSETIIWNYLLHNVQPVIFPILYERKFPVPKTYAVCGFSLFQQYAGKDLYNFFKANFLIKLEISKQLLEAAIKFSHGFDEYRLYITDFTADNIVYDVANNNIYFIDLDTIFIVDSTEAKYKSLVHKHVYVECPGCFAYSAEDIASYNMSDINIYLVCQFLREDLYKDKSKGFLHPIPDEFISTNSALWQLLNKCVDCPDDNCSERFGVAKILIKLFNETLKAGGNLKDFEKPSISGK